MYRFTSAFFLCFLALLSSVARADDVRYYDVETIIFESLDPAARTSENWKTDIVPQTPPVSVELGQPYPGQIPPQYDPKLTFKSLPAYQFQLNAVEKRMVRSRQYRILLHTAWVQPGMGPNVALPIHINRTFLTDTPVTNNLTPATSDAAPANQPAQTKLVKTRSVLDGYIKIILTRYLHADVDLSYTTGLPLTPTTPATNPSGTPAAESMNSASMGSADSMQQSAATSATATPGLPPPVVYQLHQSRRMRSKVLHYLDNPVLGMLIIITPHASK